MKKILKIIGRFVWVICLFPLSLLWMADVTFTFVLFRYIVWAVRGTKYDLDDPDGHLMWLEKLTDFVKEKLS